ncbi:VanZ family protein [Actinokineospora sp. 24-640]
MMVSLESLLAVASSVLRNPLILTGVMVGMVVAGAAGWWTAGRLGWRRGPSLAAGVSLGVALGVTMSRTVPNHSSMAGVSVDQPLCHVNGLSLVGANEVLNVLLFMPLVVFGVLAVRRVWPVLGATVALIAAIELLQPITGRGICETQDFLNNTLGAAVAAAAAGAVLALRRSRVDA